MRYTKNNGGKWIVPKELWGPAAEKLAKLENVEEREDIGPLINDLRRTAEAKLWKDPAIASMLRRAAGMLDVINTFENSLSLILRRKMAEQKMEILTRLDEMEGKPLEDPVNEFRRLIKEIL